MQQRKPVAVRLVKRALTKIKSVNPHAAAVTQTPLLHFPGFPSAVVQAFSFLLLSGTGYPYSHF